MEFDAVLVVGFIVLGIYKLFELFVKRKERIALIEKLPILINGDEEGKKINLPSISLGVQDLYGSWALRISLLLMGVGLGCILSLFMQAAFANILDARELGYKYDGLLVLINFACITFMGGTGLFIAYLMESSKEKKEKEGRN